MNNFTYTINRKLDLQKQKTWCNRGSIRDSEGYQAWLDLDNMPSDSGLPGPELLMEEGAFAVAWGDNSMQSQFYPEDQWKLLGFW